MNLIYILLGGDGYYGRNFQYYLSQKNIKFIVIDRNEIKDDDDFYMKNKLIKNHLIKYIQHDLNNKIDIHLLPINKYDSEIIIVNFAAISFVDYSILYPNETIKNNLNCCINGYKLFLNLNLKSKYIYISTDEVNVDKPNNELSPYVISKRKCESFLKGIFNLESNVKDVFIIRPVNLMDVIEPGIKGLKQKNKCLLNKIVDILKNSNDKNEKVQIHGTGEQKRMFMTMLNACDVLFNNCNYLNENENKNIIDIVNILDKRTTDLKIKDIVEYLKNIYNFEIEYINDPRGIYQDKTYLVVNDLNENNNPEIENDLKIISNVVDRLLK